MQRLDVQQLQPFLSAQDPPALLLDVREPWEVATASLQVSGVVTLNIPMQQIPARLAELDPAQPIVCFCHHGMRSAQVVAFLMQHGFADVYNLSGGIAAWSSHVDPRVPQY